VVKVSYLANLLSTELSTEQENTLFRVLRKVLQSPAAKGMNMRPKTVISLTPAPAHLQQLQSLVHEWPHGRIRRRLKRLILNPEF
jgi:hypothetical protein